jgi:hypothetical protein
MSSGNTTIIGPTILDRIEGLAYDVNAEVLFGIRHFLNAAGDYFEPSQLVVIDTSSGAATLVGSTEPDWKLGDPLYFVMSLAFDPATNTLYGTSNHDLVRIDTATGRATAVGSLGFSPLVA